MSQFTRQLELGMSGSDVKELQKFLNANNFKVAQTGAGSPGNETEYFGSLTQAALQKYQADQGIVSSGTPQTTGYGRVGPQTLQRLNQPLNYTPLPIQQTTAQPPTTPTQQVSGGQAPQIPQTQNITRDQLTQLMGDAQVLGGQRWLQSPSDIDFIVSQLQGPNAETYKQRIIDEIQKVIQFKQQQQANAQAAGYSAEAGTQNEQIPENILNAPPGTITNPLEGMYLQLPPELQTLLSDLSEYIRTLAEQGQQFNPNVQLDQATIDRFMTQAKEEYAPFYAGEKQSVLLDLTRSLQEAVSGSNFQEESLRRRFEAESTSLKQREEDRQRSVDQIMRQQGRSEEDIKQTIDRLKLEQQRGEEDLTRTFDTQFRQIGESSAERGTVFSGERQRMESELSQGRERALGRSRADLAFGLAQGERGIARGREDLGFARTEADILRAREQEAFGRTAEDFNRATLQARQALQFGAAGTSLAAERQLGSSALEGFAFPSLGARPIFGTGGVSSAGIGETLGGRVGGIFGTQPAAQQTTELTRQSELEDAERRRRILDLLGQ